MQKFPTPNPITTTLNIPAGRIQIIAADRTDTTVEIRPANPNKNRDLNTAQQTTANYHDGTLHIQTPTPNNQLLGPSGAVEVTIQLPTGSRIQSTATSTELRAAGHL